jgi:hypothetical protein
VTPVRWGLATTLKATPDQVRAFVAHHLALGAAELWLFFDDPDDPAVGHVSGLPRVRCIRCDAAHWASAGHRPDRHQNRQGRNMKWAYRRTRLPWLGHIDVDEYLLPRRPVGEVLAGLHADQVELRMCPWEALHDPGLPDDIFTSRSFRAPIRGAERGGLRDIAFGAYVAPMKAGVLSHYVGKCFFRTGCAGLDPRLHGGFVGGVRLPSLPHDRDIALLHFHAEDPARWFDRLDFRLARGAYQYNLPLSEWLRAATDAERRAFYDRVQAPDAEVRRRLREAGALIEVDLRLRDKVAALP